MTQPNEQTKIIEKDIARLAEDHQKLNERFDRHLEIYAQNGKELAALKSSVDNLRLAVEKQESRVHESLANIWVQTRKNTDDISETNVTVGKLIVRVSLIAAFASTLASSVASVALKSFF